MGELSVFSALDDEGVRQVWSSDGTRGSVERLTDSQHGFSSDDRRLVTADSFAIFEEPAGGLQVWRTDGTLDGTWPLGELDRVADVSFQGRVYSFGQAGGQAGIWEIDGSQEGPRLVVDFPGGFRLVPTPVVVGDSFYYQGEETGTLWRSDGTAEGTWKVADAPSEGRLLQPLAIAELAGFVYFVVDFGPSQDELWRTDSRLESDCIEETVCFSGAVPGRSELFLRVVGPKPNGRLWPTLVRFSTSTIDVWLTQTATGEERHYRLEGASPGSSDLSGLFDRNGFLP